MAFSTGQTRGLSCSLCHQQLSSYLLGRLSTRGLFLMLASHSQGILSNLGTEAWGGMGRSHFPPICRA